MRGSSQHTGPAMLMGGWDSVGGRVDVGLVTKSLDRDTGRPPTKAKTRLVACDAVGDCTRFPKCRAVDTTTGPSCRLAAPHSGATIILRRPLAPARVVLASILAQRALFPPRELETERPSASRHNGAVMATECECRTA